MEPKALRAKGMVAILIGLGGLSVGVGRLARPISYPAGDIRAEPWFIALDTLITVVSALALIAYGLWRLWRQPGE
jgi:hypothetical protein